MHSGNARFSTSAPAPASPRSWLPRDPARAASRVLKAVLAAVLAMVLAGLCWFAFMLWSLEHSRTSAPYYELAGPYTGPGSPVAAGDPQRYEDDVQVTVGVPRRVTALTDDPGYRPGDVMYSYTVTYANNGSRTVELVRNGIDEEMTLPNGATARGAWGIGRPQKPWFPDRLAPGERTTVAMEVYVPVGTPYLRSELRIADDHSPTYWQLPLRTP